MATAIFGFGLTRAPAMAIGGYSEKYRSRKVLWESSTASNGRLCEMAAVPPQTILCEIARLSPAGSIVEAATSQSRWDVICKR